MPFSVEISESFNEAFVESKLSKSVDKIFGYRIIL